MKKFIYVLIALLLASCAQRSPQASSPEIDLTSSTRAIADSEKEMFEFVKERFNERARLTPDPQTSPAMTPEDEATWRAQDYYILNETRFMENPDFSRLIECSVLKPEVAFFVGRLQTGEYRFCLVYPDNSGHRTMMSEFNYENTLAWLEKRMSELNCSDYRVVRIKGYEYYAFNPAGVVRVFNPRGEEMTCAEIVYLLD